MNSDNRLIFGKDETLNIVSVEPDVDGCTVFIESKDGITSKLVPYKPYILFTKPVSPNAKRLKGDQPYKYIRYYSSFDKYYDVLQKCGRKRIDYFTVRDRKESFMCLKGYTYFKGMTLNDVSVLSVDIEDTYGIRDEPNPNGNILIVIGL